MLPIPWAVLPSGLHRTDGAHHLHFISCSCYQRLPYLGSARAREQFLNILEQTRERYRFVVVGCVVLPEHIHVLVSEPERDTLADALKSLKQGVSRRLIGDADHFWQMRYYDFNIRNYEQFVEKLHYIHWNPVKRGLCERSED